MIRSSDHVCVIPFKLCGAPPTRPERGCEPAAISVQPLALELEESVPRYSARTRQRPSVGVITAPAVLPATRAVLV
jgi:hypothetical protein